MHTTFRLLLAAVCLLAGAACSPVSTPGASSGSPGATTPEPGGGTSPGGPAFPIVAEASISTTGNVTIVDIPGGPCINVTAAPILVGDYVVIANHEGTRGCSDRGAYGTSLLGYSISGGTLHELAEGQSAEATPVYDAGSGRVYWNGVFGGVVRVLDAATFSSTASAPTTLKTTSDSAGVVIGGVYYFGTINSPEGACQQPVNPNCGAIFAIDGATGTVLDSIGTGDGFRSWMGASLTTDGERLFAGGAEQFRGNEDSEFLYGCSAVVLSDDLDVVGFADPGVPGCHRTGQGGNDEDAVAGEVVLDHDSAWVQWTHASDSSNQAIIARFDHDLNELCRFTVDAGPGMVVGYYSGMALDGDGNLYATRRLAPSGKASEQEVLYRIDKDCQATEVARFGGRHNTSGPTLADDRYVLWAVDGTLYVYGLDGSVEATYTLGSASGVAGSPMIHDGVIYTVSHDGTLTIIRDSGIDGYGTATWPRYRHDNAGSGSLLTATS